MLLGAAVNFLCSLGSHEYEQHLNIPQVAFFDCHCGGCSLSLDVLPFVAARTVNLQPG